MVFQRRLGLWGPAHLGPGPREEPAEVGGSLAPPAREKEGSSDGRADEEAPLPCWGGRALAVLPTHHRMRLVLTVRRKRAGNAGLLCDLHLQEACGGHAH